MAENAGTIYSDVRIQLDKLKADVSNVQLNINKLGQVNQTTAAQTQTAWNKSFKGISAGGIAMTVALTAAFKKMVGTFAQTEQSLANVRAVSGATAEEFEMLKKAAEEAGQTTRFTASQSADALYYLASAGFSASESVDALNGVLTLAGATGSDLAMTSETVASAIAAFNLEASDADRVANVFAASISNSQATMDKLAVSMRYVAPVASAFGRSIEETAGLLQILYNNGFEASQAGTALRGALGDLANKSGPAIAKLEKLGVTFDEVNPQTNSLADIFGVLNEKVTDGSDILSIFGDRAGPAIIKLVQSGREEIEKYTEAVTGTNSAAEQYAIQNDTLAGSFDMFKSALESTTNSIIEQLAPAFRTILDTLSAVLKFITSLPGPLKALGGGFGVAALAAGTLSRVLTVLGVSATGALGPIGLLVGAVIGIGTAFYSASKAEREYNKLLKDTKEIAEGFDAELLQMTTELARLEKQEKLTKEEQIRHDKILRDLKERYPDLTEDIEENSLAVAENTLKQAEQNKVLKEQDLELLKKKYEELTTTFEDQSGVIRRELLSAWNKANSTLLNNENTTKAAQEAQREFYKELSDAKSVEDFEKIASSLGVTLENVSLQAFYTSEKIDEVGGAISSTNSELIIQNEIIQEAKKQLQELVKANNDVVESEGNQENQVDRLRKLYEEYEKAVARARFENEIGLINDIELLKERIKLKEDYIRAVIDEGYADEAVLKKRTAELDALKAQLEELLELQKDVSAEGLEDRKTYAEGYGEIQKKMLEDEAITEQYRKDKAKADREEQEKEEEEHAQKMLAIRRQLVEESINLANYLFNAAQEIGNNNTKKEIDRINKIKNADIDAINERLEAGIISEEEATEQIKNIQDKAAKDSAQLEYRQALNSWKLQGIQILANTAVGITKALSTANYIGAAFIGAQGLIQGLAHASARPNPPALQTGAIIRPQPGGTLVRVAENNNPELALNSGPEGEQFLNMFADRVAERIGGNSVNIYQNNTLNTDSLESLQRAAQVLAPALKQESKRSGNG